MAIHLPTYLYDMAPTQCRAGAPVICGSDDRLYGLRGVPAMQNHVYAYRVGQIAQLCVPEFQTSNLYFNDTIETAAWWDLTGLVPVSLGPDVTTIEAVIYHEDGYIRLYAEDKDGWSGTSSTVYCAGLTKSVLTLAVNDTTGIAHRVKLLGKTDAGEHAYYYAYCIYESVLIAVEIP